jgi:SAM-dependent MidA family methyltransferase
MAEAKPKLRMSRQLSIREVADLLQMEGRFRQLALIRQLKKLEQTRGVKILIESGSGRGKRYRVTLATLREHHPDLFYRRDEVVEHMREYIEELDERFDAVTDKVQALAQVTGEKFRKIEARVSILETHR